MASSLPAAPTFGQPMPVTASLETLTFLAHRRSASAATLEAPGPNAAQLHQLLTLATRVPDHGKLSPWRFVVLEGEGKAALVRSLRLIAAEQGHAEAALTKLSAPPLSVLVISHPVEAKIPLWEQQLSAGAVCMTLLIAAQAMGFGVNWITDWYSLEPRALALLSVGEGETVAGFIHLGTAAEPPLERVRPEVDTLTRRLAL